MSTSRFPTGIARVARGSGKARWSWCARSTDRWDAQRAVGEPEPIDAGLAVDGIDEVLWMIPIRPVGKKPTGSGETVHFHCTDREGEWLARLTPAGVEVERGHAKADVAARGPASDLLLLLWGRVEPDALDVVGDRAMLARFQDDVRV